MIGYDKGNKLGLFDDKGLVTILGNVYGITLGHDVRIDQGFLDGSFDGYKNDKLEELLIGDSLVYNFDKLFGSNKGIKLGLYHGKGIGNIIVNVDRITLGIDVETELSSLDGSLHGSNDGNIEGLLIGDSLGSTDVKVFGSNEGIKLGLYYGKGLGTIL